MRLAIAVFFSATVALGATVDVTISGFAFSPSSITITQGDTVRWTNNDGVSHTSTSDTFVWDSGTLGTGSTFPFTFTSSGSFPYHCAIHSFMTGVVNVTAGAPFVTIVNPPNGPSTGATGVVVSGSGFVAAFGLRVLFGGIDGAVNLGASSSTSIAVTTPAHAAGTVDVEVINPDGQNATLAGGFTYDNCSFTIAPIFANYSSAAATGATVQVTTSAGCSWTATTQDGSFVTITGGASGMGSGTVTYDVAANGTSAARLSILTIADIGFEADQSANGIAAMTLTATAIGGSQVDLSWTLAAGATSYNVTRSQNGGALAPLASTSGTSYSDTIVTAGVGYVYRIFAFQNSTTISYSNVDLAVPFDFTDPSLGVGTTIVRAIHFNELREALNAARVAAAWPAFSFTDTLAAGVPVKRIHLMELRSSLDSVRAAFGLTPVSYTDPSVTAGVTVIKGGHLQQIRDGVK